MTDRIVSEIEKLRRLNLLYILIALILNVSCAFTKPVSHHNASKAVGLQKEARKLANIVNPDDTYRYSKSDKDSTAIEILEGANALDPNNQKIALDLASIYYRNKMYRETAILAEKYLKKDTTGDFYSLCVRGHYLRDDNRNYKKADRIIEKGYRKFPDNPRLCVAFTRHLLSMQEKCDFLKSILKKNQYHIETMDELSFKLKNTSNVTESMYYGELVRLFDTNQSNSDNESDFLFIKYKDCFKFENNKLKFDYNFVQLDFSRILREMDNAKKQKRGVIIGVNSKTSSVRKSTFSKTLEDYYLKASFNVREFSFSNLILIRKNLIKLYFMYEKNKQNPDRLFAFHKQLIDQNLFEAYNYWLFRYGVGEKEFNKWYADHQNDYEKVEAIVRSKFRS